MQGLRLLVLSAVLGVVPALALGDETEAPPRLHVGPFLQNATPTSIWVVWEAREGAPGRVAYGPSRALGKSVSSTAKSSNGPTYIHQAQLTGLSPDTAYYYQVRSGPVESAVVSFRTPPLPAEESKFRFVAYSDTQNYGKRPKKHTEVVNAGILRYFAKTYGPSIADELAFVVHAGDLVNDGRQYAQWKDEFFDEAQNLLQHVPVYPALGNHENDSQYYFDYFNLPTDGSAGYLEHWYTVDYSNVRVISLDSNGPYRLAVQLQWLEEVLAETATAEHVDFVFALFHHAHLSEVWNPGEADFCTEIVRRLEAFSSETGKPSVHFYGHTHAYSRGQSRDHRHVMVNVASGEGYLDYWGIVPPVDYPEFETTLIDWGFVLLEVQAGDDPQFQLRRVSRGSIAHPRDNEIVDELTVRLRNTPPAAPRIVERAGGEQDPDRVEVRASAYRDVDGDSHRESHFQLTTKAGAYEKPVAERWLRHANWFSPQGAAEDKPESYRSVDANAGVDLTQATFEYLAPGTTYYWRVRYRDAGLVWSEWSAEAEFATEDRADVTLLASGFEDVKLGPPVHEQSKRKAVWSAGGPTDWGVDRRGVPSVNDAARGVKEWEGWAFVDKAFWIEAAGGQRRGRFERGSGIVAVADPDEWDDRGEPHKLGPYSTRLTAPVIALADVAPRTLRLAFDSSWRPSGKQTGQVVVRFDGRAEQVIAEWSSDPASPHYHVADQINRRVVVPVANPAGARRATFSFVMKDAGNDWWWALDNVLVTAAPR